MGLESVLLHEATDLIGNFLEHLLGEVASGHALVELNKLDNVTAGGDSAGVAETLTVTIELLHSLEVGVADANDDDGARHVGELADDVDGLRHVMNGTIS